MVLLISLLIVAVVLTVGIVVACVFVNKSLETKEAERRESSRYDHRYNGDDGPKEAEPPYKPGKKKFLFALLGPSVCLFLLCGCFCKVGANEVGIVYDETQGGVQSWTYGQGFHAKSIFQHVTAISTANRTGSVTTYGQTNDGQSAQFELSIIYSVSEADAGNFFKKTNSSDISSGQLDTIVKKNLQLNTSQYNIFELLSEGLETVRSGFEASLKKSLMDEFCVTLHTASFDDIDAGEEVEAILKAKAEADQKILIAQKEAEASLITAQNQAEIQKLTADAEAYATRVKGVASGEAASAYIAAIQDMISKLYVNINGIDKSLVAYDAETGYITSFPTAATEVMPYSDCSSLILGIIFYDTWDGKLPEVLTSDSLSALIGSLISSGSSGSSPSSSSSSGTGA